MQTTELLAIAVARPDGGVSIRRIPIRASAQCYSPEVAAAMGFRMENGEWVRTLDDAAIEADLTRAGLAGLPWQIVNEDEIPDRQFRDAWTLTAKGIAHDMDKARAIAADRLARDAVLKAEAERIAAVSEHSGVATAKTVDDLKAITLESLTG